ncbi:uncharacterized protein LOC121377191 [Gigantopelta aegis]|uniref:uncharacterized protein LOC121377191 n=1 Tax=Gigantopelta aegis TaxID=1735272 RepID=UPI001B88842D|nr:uncharacterized protein LOC121377191 [Gigantopelta aegis]
MCLFLLKTKILRNNTFKTHQNEAKRKLTSRGENKTSNKMAKYVQRISESIDESDFSNGSPLSSFSDNDDNRHEDHAILPYQFEPKAPPRTNSEADTQTSTPAESDDFDNPDRLRNTDWCLCGNCEVQPTLVENRCCMEIDAVTKTMDDYANDFQMEPLGCITTHPGFISTCLDTWVQKHFS